jgi:hypothetical protein
MSNTAHFWMPEAGLSPEKWLERHQAARESFWGPRDTRVPAFVPNLVKELCSLRSSLEVLRWVYGHLSEELYQFCRTLKEASPGAGAGSASASGSDRQGLVGLIENFMARVDWREQDILEMMLEYLQVASGKKTEPGAPGDWAATLQAELQALEGLRLWDRAGYHRAVQGLIAEARASFVGLNWGFQSLRNTPERRSNLDEDALRLLLATLRTLLGLRALPRRARRRLPAPPGRLLRACCGAG